MKRIAALMMGTALFLVAFAATPAARVSSLRDATKIKIIQRNKEQTDIYEEKRVGELRNLIEIRTLGFDVETAGRPLYTIEWYRGSSSKPMEKLWVDAEGKWGFSDLSGPYGQDRKLLAWLKKAIKL